MGSHSASFVSMNTKASTFSYTDPGFGKLKHPSGKEAKQPPKENTKRSTKMGILNVFRIKKDKNNSSPSLPPRKSSAEKESFKTPAGENEYSYRISEGPIQDSALDPPARTPGRPSYDKIGLPIKPLQRARKTASLPHQNSSGLTKETPTRQASLGHGSTRKVQETPQEVPIHTKLGQETEPEDDIYDDVGELYSKITENTGIDINEDDMYEVALVHGNTSVGPNADDLIYDDLCTDSCDTANLQLQSSSDDDHSNAQPKPLSKKQSVSLLNVRQEVRQSNDRDDCYIMTEAKPGPTQPQTKPPKPTPRTSLKLKVLPQKPTKIHTLRDVKVPPKPAPKPRKQWLHELPEIQALLEKAQKVIKDSTKVVTKTNFTARLLDKEGGRLQLLHHGVTLDVPPGALEILTMVYIYVQRSLDFATTEEGLASPLVHCGVSGLKFKTPVVLTFPVHLKEPSAWELKGIKRDSFRSPWKDLSSERCQDSLVAVKDNMCTMVVDHFTLFGVSARPKELRGASGGSGESRRVKPCRVCVFLPKDTLTSSGHLQLRVRIWDESPETIQKVKDAERGSTVIDTPRTFFLCTSDETGCRQPGLDVSITLQGLNDSWRSDTSEEIISYEYFLLHPQGRVDASVTFNLTLQNRAGEGEHHSFRCDFVIGQRAHFHLATIIKAVHDIHDSIMHVEEAAKFPSPMSASGFRRLCEYLDEQQRWKLLADTYFGRTQGCTFDRWPCPSTALLRVILGRSTVQDPQSTLRELSRTLLDECRLHGAAEIVDQEIANKSESKKMKHPVQCTSEESIYEVILPENDQGRITQSQATSRREPEENDEEESGIHTLQSNIPPIPRIKPVATQQEWPPKLVPTLGDLCSTDVPDEMTASGGEFRHDINNLTRSTMPYVDDVPGYAECPVGDQEGRLEEYANYQNFSVVSKHLPTFPKGYIQIKKP